jgi:hypothetical protein
MDHDCDRLAALPYLTGLDADLLPLGYVLRDLSNIRTFWKSH